MKRKILMFKFEEDIGGYDAAQIRDKLNEFFSGHNIEFILLPYSVASITKDDIKEFISKLKGLLK